MRSRTKHIKYLSLSLVTLILLAVPFQNCQPFQASNLLITDLGAITPDDGNDGGKAKPIIYDDVYDELFVTQCLSCHYEGNNVGASDLSTYEATMASGTVVAGDSQASGIIAQLESGLMPPGFPLSPDQYKILADWIDQGALKEDPTPANQAPMVSAEADVNIILPMNSVELSAQASDSDGTIAGALWRQISGPSEATIVTPADLITTINGLVEGTYEFSITVEDDQGAAASDSVRVVVSPEDTKPNQPPNVSAGQPKTITLPTDSVVLSGSATDFDGTISAYLWEQTDGPSTATLTDADTRAATASKLIEGTYTFRFTVTDDRNAQASTMTTVKVNPVANEESFAAINQDIFKPKCLQCHNNRTQKGDYSMATYQQIISQITPGDASQSAFWLLINIDAMPKSSVPPLTDAEKSRVFNWIEQGAKNN